MPSSRHPVSGRIGRHAAFGLAPVDDADTGSERRPRLLSVAARKTRSPAVPQELGTRFGVNWTYGLCELGIRSVSLIGPPAWLSLVCSEVRDVVCDRGAGGDDGGINGFGESGVDDQR